MGTTILLILVVLIIGVPLLGLGAVVWEKIASARDPRIKALERERDQAKKEAKDSRRIANGYEDFILRLAADDVGDPALEARLTLTENRRNNLELY